MLSENIRNNRKKNNLSQDELAEKLGVSRQSVSFWETGQTQPTIDNIIALAKIFNISTDILLENSENTSVFEENTAELAQPSKNKKSLPIIIIAVLCVIFVALVAVIVAFNFKTANTEDTDDTTKRNSAIQVDSSALNGDSVTGYDETEGTETTGSTTAPSGNSPEGNSSNNSGDITSAAVEVPFDLFTYCKNFAIEKGNLNGDYSIYQQPAAKYGGYDNEYFSISYWSGSDMVEFCLHCPLSETYSHNFYLRMRGGYNGKYEYLSSKYFRDTGESLRSADGYIDPAVFYDGYPIGFDNYQGSTDGQTQFMEDSRVGICDLIRLIKAFVTAENMECEFSDFGFVNF